jgi:hypothetical protein
MTRRSRRIGGRLLALAFLTLALGLFEGALQADADDPAATLTAQGWWWQAQVGLPTPLPPPPTVQPGQLQIESAPSDDRGAAFAAVRYTIAANRTAQSLTLKIANESATPTVLLACRTGSAWSPADAGAWTAAPKVDSRACVNGTKAIDGESWTFAVGTLQLETVLDIAIVPGIDPATPTQTPFSIVFDAPANDSVAAIDVTPPSVPMSSPPVGPTASPPPRSPQQVATALPADKIGETATSPAKQVASQPTANSSPATTSRPSRRDKRLGYLLIALAATSAAYAWRKDRLMPVSASAGAGPASDDQPRGLGRFTSVRLGQPPSLT